MEKSKICEVCQTVHGTQAEYENHVLGNKHKRKVLLIETDAQNKARKLLYEKNGVFIFHLPLNTPQDELLAYVSTYGKVESKKFGVGYAKFLFADEKSAIDFKKRRHIFKNQTLKVTAWNIQIPSLTSPPVAKPAVNTCLQMDVIVANVLSTDMDMDQEIAALQSMLMPPDFINFACNKLCNDIRSALMKVWDDFSIHPFGSMITGLAFKGSDMDVVVDKTFTLFQHERHQEVFQESYRINKNQMNAIARPLRSYFDKVITIHKAKVPIIKCVHRSTNVSCDISFTNITAVQNSHLIRRYLSSDPRVKSLMVILKYWAMCFDLTKSGFSNYALIMMGIFYLMQLDDPLLPPVIHLERNIFNKLYVDVWNVSFDLNYQFLESKNTSSTLDLLLGFFEFYASFDYGMNVICPRIGIALPKIYFKNLNVNLSELTSSQKYPEVARTRMATLKLDTDICVQDPFVLDCNITRSIPQSSALRIQAMCMTSACVLREDRGTSGPLKHLFKKRTETLSLVPTLLNKPVSNNLEIRINVSNYVGQPTIEPGVTVSDAQNTWYNEVFATVITIFEEVFKFETSEDNDRLAIKRLKTEINNVNASEMNSTNTRIIICESIGPDLCTNRKQTGKDLNTKDSKMSFLEFQKAVTMQMLAQLEKGPIKTVKFKCSFHMRKDPTHIILELSDFGSSKDVFNLWASYLAAHLSGWVKNIMSL